MANVGLKNLEILGKNLNKLRKKTNYLIETFTEHGNPKTRENNLESKHFRKIK